MRDSEDFEFEHILAEYDGTAARPPRRRILLRTRELEPVRPTGWEGVIPRSSLWGVSLVTDSR